MGGAPYQSYYGYEHDDEFSISIIEMIVERTRCPFVCLLLSNDFNFAKIITLNLHSFSSVVIIIGELWKKEYQSNSLNDSSSCSLVGEVSSSS